MNAEAKSSFIDLFPLFSVLSSEDKAMLAEMMEYKVKPKYSFIHLPGDATEYIYFLAKGTVKIGTHSSDGKEIIKSLIHPTAMFGELGLIGEPYYKDFAQALKHTHKLHDQLPAQFPLVTSSSCFYSRKRRDAGNSWEHKGRFF